MFSFAPWDSWNVLTHSKPRVFTFGPVQIIVIIQLALFLHTCITSFHGPSHTLIVHLEPNSLSKVTHGIAKTRQLVPISSFMSQNGDVQFHKHLQRRSDNKTKPSFVDSTRILSILFTNFQFSQSQSPLNNCSYCYWETPICPQFFVFKSYEDTLQPS